MGKVWLLKIFKKISNFKKKFQNLPKNFPGKITESLHAQIPHTTTRPPGNWPPVVTVGTDMQEPPREPAFTSLIFSDGDS